MIFDITYRTINVGCSNILIDLQLKKARLDRDGNAKGTNIHHDSEQIASDRNSMIESLKTIADSIKSDK